MTAEHIGLIGQPQEMMPWLNIRLTKDAMDHLWDSINNLEPIEEATPTLVGNISKSNYIQDKDNRFFENVLKQPTEFLYFRDSWNIYFDVHISKSKSPPVFTLNELWVNYQKQYEFNPPHTHQGLFSFVVFMKIPTHWKEQHALPMSANSNTPSASDFQFLLGIGHGPVQSQPIPLSPNDEGRMLFFPSWLTHQVHPFYECEEERITISGNISLEQLSQSSLNRKEAELEQAQKTVNAMERSVKRDKNMLNRLEKEKNDAIL